MPNGSVSPPTQSRKDLFLATIVALTIGTICLSLVILWPDLQGLWMRHKLANALRSGDQVLIPNVVTESRRWLGTDEVVECLIVALQSSEPAARQSAAYAIWDYSVRYAIENTSSRRLESPPEVVAAVPELTNALRDVRKHASWCLGELGAAAGDTVPRLNELAKDNDGVVSITAAIALQKINAQSLSESPNANP